MDPKTLESYLEFLQASDQLRCEGFEVGIPAELDYIIIEAWTENKTAKISIANEMFDRAPDEIVLSLITTDLNNLLWG